MNKSDTVDVKWKRVDGLKKVFILHDFSINLSYVLIYFWFDTSNTCGNFNYTNDNSSTKGAVAFHGFRGQKANKI